jgi:hypothetical protein
MSIPARLSTLTFSRPSYTVAQFAEESGAGEKAVYDAIRAGELVARRVSPRKTVITLADGLDWLESLAPVEVA